MKNEIENNTGDTDHHLIRDQREDDIGSQTSKETSILDQFPITEDSIERLRKVRPKSGKQKLRASHREAHIKSVKDYAEEIVREKGTGLVSATECMVALQIRGHAKTVHGVPMKDSKAIGDALGGHGLNLPYVLIGSTRYYALAYANATDQEVEAQRNQLGNPIVTQ